MLPAEQQSSEVAEDQIDLDAIEAYMLTRPDSEKVEIPVNHHFGPGVYIRQIKLPAGAIAIGHEQKSEHLNILLSGAVAMYKDGAVSIVRGPLIFTGTPGRKLGQVIEDCIWMNVFPNPDNCTDIEELENRFVNKSEMSKAVSVKKLMGVSK